MQTTTENEIKVLDHYETELDEMLKYLSDADTAAAQRIMPDFNRKVELFTKQVFSFKQQFPEVDEGRLHESLMYLYQACAKIFSSGFAHKTASKSDSLVVGIAARAIANHQDKNNATQALELLDKAINILDNPQARLFKANIYNSLKQQPDALRELNHVIAHFSQSDFYIQARTMKDEIENPKSSGFCFIATAAYGSPLAPEVIYLRTFRDEVLLQSPLGKAFVKTYYFISPPLASLIDSVKSLQWLTRKAFLKPLLRVLRHLYDLDGKNNS